MKLPPAFLLILPLSFMPAAVLTEESTVTTSTEPPTTIPAQVLRVIPKILSVKRAEVKTVSSSSSTERRDATNAATANAQPQQTTVTSSSNTPNVKVTAYTAEAPKEEVKPVISFSRLLQSSGENSTSTETKEEKPVKVTVSVFQEKAKRKKLLRKPAVIYTYNSAPHFPFSFPLEAVQYHQQASEESVAQGPALQQQQQQEPKEAEVPQQLPVQYYTEVPQVQNTLYNVAQDGHAQHPQQNYNFAYQVYDSRFGMNHGHSEVRSGNLVQGSYIVTDPDGMLRIVTYKSDPVNGFNAVVDRQPLINYQPQHPSYPYPYAAGSEPLTTFTYI